MSPKYAIGIDFGTESGRALLVDVADGREVATAVYPYSNGVIDEYLPESGVRLEPDWALQDPDDYIRTLQETVPAVLAESGVDPADVIGVSIDFTACTMLPAKADGTALAQLPEYRDRPHAWVKLWKHHAAQPEADRINEVAREMGETWLDLYGGKISSEWFFSKALQILDEDPEIYRCRRPADRSGGLGHLADDGAGDAQLLHGRLQGHLAEERGFPQRASTSLRCTRTSPTSWTRR